MAIFAKKFKEVKNMTDGEGEDQDDGGDQPEPQHEPQPEQPGAQ